MLEKITFAKLEKELDFFKKMYDAVRIVDPVRKQVVEYRGCSISETDKICYEYWKSKEICNNCISVRAYHENKSYMKLEQAPEAILLVTALPLETSGKPAVLELLKNATHSMMIGSGDYNDGQKMCNVISALNDMVIKDPLTFMYNRRFISDRLPVDIVKAAIENWPLSIILLDIDHFKDINDTYGHIIGDFVLQEVANILKNCIRADNDWVARYGGDEFLVCLNNVDHDEAYQVAERIRISIERNSIPIQDENIRFTISLGVYTTQGATLTAEEIISCADRKLYEAKKSGRNCTVAGGAN